MSIEMIHMQSNLFNLLIFWFIIFCNRVSSHVCHAGHHLLDVPRNCPLLASKHLSGCMLHSFLWFNWGALLLGIFNQVPWRSLVSSRTMHRFYDHHVHLALWDHKEVRVWCWEQGFHQLASKPRPYPRLCTCARHWPHTHWARIRNPSHLLPLRHQLACISPGIAK